MLPDDAARCATLCVMRRQRVVYVTRICARAPLFALLLPRAYASELMLRLRHVDMPRHYATPMPCQFDMLERPTPRYVTRLLPPTTLFDTSAPPSHHFTTLLTSDARCSLPHFICCRLIHFMPRVLRHVTPRYYDITDIDAALRRAVYAV